MDTFTIQKEYKYNMQCLRDFPVPCVTITDLHIVNMPLLLSTQLRGKIPYRLTTNMDLLTRILPTPFSVTPRFTDRYRTGSY